MTNNLCRVLLRARVRRPAFVRVNELPAGVHFRLAFFAAVFFTAALFFAVAPTGILEASWHDGTHRPVPQIQ